MAQVTPSAAPLVAEDVSRLVRNIPLHIDYTIIEHFSHHLYGSPHKAIEELVINGFDAFATEVRVFLDGVHTPGRIVVWDNGDSMDADGMEAMWQISKSPKKNNRIIGKNGKTRNVIGKFGIGKVASYTLGDSISHICKKDNEYLAVRMDYSKLMEGREEKSAPTDEEVGIFSLTRQQAEESVRRAFDEIPPSLAAMFKQPRWTFAVIEELKKDKEIVPWRLRLVLGNAMPLRPDFSVWVDEQPIQSSLGRLASFKSGDMSDPSIRAAIVSEWKEAHRAMSISTDVPRFGIEVGLDPASPNTAVPYVETDKLGKVWGEATLYEDSLKKPGSKDGMRSYGFFIMVLGRLLNDLDPNFLLGDPSFGTFYRSQYVLNVDALDNHLLADRERILIGTVESKELAMLQHAIYIATTKWKIEADTAAEEEDALNNSLPLFSRKFYYEPITALRNKFFPDAEPNFDVRKPLITREAVGSDEPVSQWNESGSAMEINITHPYYKALATTFGANTEKGRKTLREFERIAISEMLFQGHLIDIGLEDNVVNDIMIWRDKHYRLLARAKSDSIHTLSENLRIASKKTNGSIFEKAVVEMLRAMGFESERDGDSGKKDGVFIAPCGEQSYTFTFEAKGKLNGELENDKAEVSGAGAHRVGADAEHAVIIARTFAGFKRDAKNWPMVLRECQAMQDQTVSIMEVEALIALAEAMNEYYYSLADVKTIFTTIEPPESKLERIQKLGDPFSHFDYQQLLRTLWESQIEYGGSDPISWYDIWQKKYRKQGVTRQEFLQQMQALQLMANPLIKLEEGNLVTLHQAPDKIISLIEMRMNIPQQSEEEPL